MSLIMGNAGFMSSTVWSASSLVVAEVSGQALKPTFVLVIAGRSFVLEFPIGSKVVPFCGSYLGSYKAIPKKSYFGANG